jgi:hypothetical protein
MDNQAAVRVWRAVESGNLVGVRRGIESGVPVNWKNEDEMERTFLHVAASEGRVHVIKFLLEKKARIEALDEDDSTPLHRAAKSGNVEAVVALLKAGAMVDSRDYDRNTPLHVAARKNLLACALALLEHGAVKDAENTEGKAAYEVCSDARVREAILQYGEEEEEETDESGRPLPKRRSCWNCGKGCFVVVVVVVVVAVLLFVCLFVCCCCLLFVVCCCCLFVVCCCCFMMAVVAANRCTACRVANYCSTECQKGNWKEHKEECARLKKSNSEVKKHKSLLFLVIIIIIIISN